MIDYTRPASWDRVWKRPYSNYEKHHQIFWSLIRKKSHGKVLDLACGPASYWRGMEVELWACDFSEAAIAEAKRNCPQGRFLVEQIPTHIYDGNSFDVIVISGLVNYYRDLAPLTEMVARLTKAGSLILITINVIDDFPDRHWDEETIRSTFGTLGKLSVQFYEKVGWFVEIGVVQ